MAHTLVRVYDSFIAAQDARNALLGCGFSPSCIQLDSRADEAGPVDGNFILDYKDTENGPRTEFSQSLFGSEPRVEGGKRSDVAERGNHVLTVDAADEAQIALAEDITMRFGAINITERTDRRSAT